MGRAKDLPVELWINILYMTVDSATGYEDCTSTDFPQFLHRWRNQDFDANKEWKRLRLVCRSWSIILGKRKVQHIQQLCTDGYDGLIHTTNLQSIVVPENSFWPHQKLKPYPLDQTLYHVTKDIASISFISLKEQYSPQAHEPFIGFLMEHACYFQNLKTLSLEVTRHLGPHFWSALEDNFPNLVSLRITGRYNDGNGHITLPKLRILEIGLNSPPECLFPLLEHLSIVDQPASAYLEFVQKHASGLKSIITPEYWLFGAGLRETDRVYLPKLELFGGTKDTLIKAQIPAYHPLQHIYITDSFRYSGLTIPGIMARYPNLRYLTFDCQPVCSLTMWSIRRTCKKNRVNYMDVASGQRIKTSFLRWIIVFWKHILYFTARILQLLAI